MSALNRQSKIGNRKSLGFFMHGPLVVPLAELLLLDASALLLLILGRRVIATLAFGAFQRNDVAHSLYSSDILEK